MKKVLILGAGMVARPIVRHLLKNGHSVTLATPEWTRTNAEAMIAGFDNGHTEIWTVEEEGRLDALIASHDITVSLLPYVYHLIVAGHCLKNGKNMVTTSYVKPEMRALDSDAKKAGIIILNECGLDPGIDHMSAKKIIDLVHEKGGKIEEFFSICGALPAPESADNPFRYKFSWSPKGVVLAGNNDAKYLRDGNIVELPTSLLFRDPVKLDFPSIGPLDVYPNRDSLSYIDIYNIPETKTIFRGTFRYPGWCETLDAMKRLNLISPDKKDFTGMSYADFVAASAGFGKTDDIRKALAELPGEPITAHAISALEWLGLFSSENMNRGTDSPFEITSDLMIERMMIGSNERDMVAMMHLFVAVWPDGSRELIRSSMLDFGTPSGDTSVARTVALPAAMAVEMILSGEIGEKGVHIPVIPSIYYPILDNLSRLGIGMKEEFGLPMSLKP